jgi:hypothetical protein
MIHFTSVAPNGVVIRGYGPEEDSALRSFVTAWNENAMNEDAAPIMFINTVWVLSNLLRYFENRPGMPFLVSNHPIPFDMLKEMRGH